ncbi:13855_t:CDS:1, partial [Cetraspora pellucida]
ALFMQKYNNRMASRVFQRHPNDKLFITNETTKKVTGDIHLDDFKYIQCQGQTVTRDADKKNN